MWLVESPGTAQLSSAQLSSAYECTQGGQGRSRCGGPAAVSVTSENRSTQRIQAATAAGSGALSRSAPLLWNALPPLIRNTGSLSQFKSKLRTQRFISAYPPGSSPTTSPHHNHPLSTLFKLFIFYYLYCFLCVCFRLYICLVRCALNKMYYYYYYYYSEGLNMEAVSAYSRHQGSNKSHDRLCGSDWRFSD